MAFIISKEIFDMIHDAMWLVVKAQVKERIDEADADRLGRRASLAELERRAASAPPAINLRVAALISWLLSLFAKS